MNTKLLFPFYLLQNLIIGLTCLMAWPQISLANGNACKIYYRAPSLDRNVRRIQDNLLSSLKNDSIQVTVATEYYLQKLKTELGGTHTSSDTMAAAVNDLIAEVTQLTDVIAKADSTIPRTEALRLKVMQFSKDFSKPDKPNRRSQKKAALAEEILIEFNALKSDKAYFYEYLKPIAELRSQLQNQLQNLEYDMASVSTYKQALNPVISNFENELARNTNQNSIGLALNQLMHEDNGATSNLKFLSFAHTALSNNLQMLSSLEQTIRTQQHNTMATFLLETGLSPSLLEGEIQKQAAEKARLEKENADKVAAQAASKAAQNAQFQKRIVDIKVTDFTEMHHPISSVCTT